MIYTVIALECLGYDPDSPAVQWAWRQLDDLLIEEGDRARVQPCVSPVWDTAIATIALADAGVPDDRARAGPRGRLAARQGSPQSRATGRRAGPGVEPSGWHFQYPQRVLSRHRRHGHGPDGALAVAARPTTPAVQDAVRRGVELAAGHAEPRRRLGGLRRRHRQPGPDEGPVRRPQRDARPELRRHHRPRPRAARARSATGPTIRRSPAAWTISGGRRSREGCWYGRWGVNYIYGTWQVLQGLKAIDFPMDHPALVDGRPTGWNRSSKPAAAGARPAAATTTRARWGPGTPTASQTAWAVLGLIAAGRAAGEAVRRGIEYLLETQSRRRHLGRGRVHRHRLPQGVLPEVPSLSDLLPADGDLRATARPSARACVADSTPGPGLPDPGSAQAARLN